MTGAAVADERRAGIVGTTQGCGIVNAGSLCSLNSSRGEPILYQSARIGASTWSRVDPNNSVAANVRLPAAGRWYPVGS
jgi:hypothetical protein